MLRKFFANAIGIKVPDTALFSTGELQGILQCFMLSGETSRKRVTGTGGDFAEYAIDNRSDGKTLTVDIHIHRAGEDYKTRVLAETVLPSLYAVKAITFDNRAEKLVSRTEIKNVLNYIGRCEVYAIDCDRVPKPHNRRGLTFGRLPRALARLQG